ncbi:hypothetical protein EWB00_007627, partial [Schistosoma japonicum]
YSASRFFTASWKYIYITWSLQCPLSTFSGFNELSSCETFICHKGLPAISFTQVFDKKKGDSNCPSVRISDITDSKTYSPVIKDSGQNVTSNSECVFPLSKNSGLFVNHENQLTVVDPFLSSDDGFSVAARKLRGRRRRGKHNFRGCSSISPLRLDQSGLLQTSSIESVTIQPVSAVVPMMVGRRRGRRGTVRGNVGSGESFSPLRLSESAFSEPAVEKENVDANSMSECSAMKVVETNAVCILTAIDSKLTDRDKEGVSMSVNGDLNSPVSCRSVISPDKGVTIQPVSAVVPMMVGRRRGRRGTVRGNVGSGESFSPLRLSESAFSEPAVEKENVDANSMSECSAMKVVETNAVCILTAIDSKLTDRDKEGVSMSVNGDLNSPVSCRSVISPDKGGQYNQ